MAMPHIPLFTSMAPTSIKIANTKMKGVVAMAARELLLRGHQIVAVRVGDKHCLNNDSHALDWWLTTWSQT